MKDQFRCLRCESEMQCVGKETFQLGKTGWILGDLPNLLAGGLPLTVYVCKNCRKVEFFMLESDISEDEPKIAQIVCPNCKNEHDIDYPKCPFCGFKC